jgi:hypothetical protein
MKAVSEERQGFQPFSLGWPVILEGGSMLPISRFQGGRHGPGGFELSIRVARLR